MWCTRWFLPLLLLPLPTAPPFFLVLFLLTLALHAKPCFYCIVLLAALFLSSCYWQSFPLDAQLSVPWADNITTFSEAINVTMMPHITSFKFTSPVVQVADRCWCDFASGLFEPYDVQKWERDSIQAAVVQIETRWKQSLQPDTAATSNATATLESSHPELEPSPAAPSVYSVRNETFTAILRSLFSRRTGASGSSSSLTPSLPIVSVPPAEAPTKPPAAEPLKLAEPILSPGQFDMRPFGFEDYVVFLNSVTPHTGQKRSPFPSSLPLME